jgi:HPt (histidine-containing phosphotransfer) domain-containing protein
MSHPTDPAGPANESSPNVLDVGVFHELVESLQIETAAAVYRKFVENATLFIGELRAQDDADRIETFHTLKGSAAMMGATRMAELAARLQAQGSTVQVEPAIQQLSDELEQFRAAVAKMFASV